MAPHVSYYASVRRPGSQQTIAIDDWIAGIRSGRWKAPVEKARAEYQANGKSDEYKRFKDALSAVTPNGVFSYRNNEKLVESSCSVHGDVDALSPGLLQHTLDLMIDCPLLYYLFISPSGDGIKFGFKTPRIADDVEYKRRYSAFERHVSATYGVTLDKACKDISRACFVSYDPHAVYNADCDLFHEIDDPIQGPEPKTAVVEQVKPSVFYASDRTEHPGLDYAIRSLETAALHTKNATRIRMGRLVGGLIAGGQLDSSAANTLADVAANNSTDPEQARKDIAYGIRYGKSAPIFSDRNTRLQQYRSARVEKARRLSHG